MVNTLSNFIPEIWSINLQKILDKMYVFAELVNRDYEGEIKGCGSIVHVRTFGDIQVQVYTRNMTLTPQDLPSPMSNMTINTQDTFSFQVDDMDKAQADIKILEGYSKRGGQAIKEVIDQSLHAVGYGNAPTAATLGSSSAPIVLTKDNIYSYIVNLWTVQTNVNCPMEGRNLVVSPTFYGMLLNSAEFTRATGVGDKTVTEGKVGTVAGYTVHVSTNLLNVNGNTPLLALTKDYISFAMQLEELEPFAPSLQFVKGIKGLYLYGSAVFTNTSSNKGPDKSGGVIWAQGL